jgi:hypothetical protein
MSSGAKHGDGGGVRRVVGYPNPDRVGSVEQIVAGWPDASVDQGATCTLCGSAVDPRTGWPKIEAWTDASGEVLPDSLRVVGYAHGECVQERQWRSN